MKQRFDGYNRHDYYYPRSLRDAFGHDESVEVSTFNMEEANNNSIYDMYILIAIILPALIIYFN